MINCADCEWKLLKYFMVVIECDCTDKGISTGFDTWRQRSITDMLLLFV